MDCQKVENILRKIVLYASIFCVSVYIFGVGTYSWFIFGNPFSYKPEVPFWLGMAAIFESIVIVCLFIFGIISRLNKDINICKGNKNGTY